MKKKWIACWLAAALALTSGAAPAMGAEFVSAADGNVFSDTEAPVSGPEAVPDVPAEAEASVPAEAGAEILAPEDTFAPAEPETSVPADTNLSVAEVPDQPVSPESPSEAGNPVSPAPSSAPAADSAAEPEAESSTEPFQDLSTEAVFASSGTADISTNAARISCKGYSAGQVRITAKIAAPIKSMDDSYYLFQVNPATNKLTRQVASLAKPAGKNKSITFRLDTSGHPEYVMSKYALAVKVKSSSKPSSFRRVSGAGYVSSPEKAALNTAAYKLPKTKKGLQTTEYSQLKATNSKAVFLNLAMSTVLASNAEAVSYTYNGKKYSFNKIGGYTNLVSQCNQKGIPVTIQLLLDWTPSTKGLAAAKSPRAGSAYYAWNSTSSASRQKMEALFSFLSELFSSDSCYVSNWILGNEINSARRWNYAGNVSQSTYVKLYSEAFRCLYNAVRSRRASSKCFICLDHYWNTTREEYAGKSILNSFHASLKNLQANVNWNLAYHAYPFPLTDARFWSGKYKNDLTNYSTSPVISLNNLSVLTNYIKKNFGSKTRVILSEQGFTSSQGQDIQAAALALGYYIAACNPMVDTFHIRSYEDQAHEVAQGLAMGIRGKKAFQVFKYMDSSKSLRYTSSFLKKQVGRSWSKRVPWYSSKRLSRTYRK